MTWEEDFIEHCIQAVPNPGEASSTERYTVAMTREQYEELLRGWEEMRVTGNYLLIPVEWPNE